MLYCPTEDARMLTILNSNIAICYSQKEDYDSVIHYTTDALKHDPNFKKALLNRAICYEKTDKLEDAFEGFIFFPNSRLQKTRRN